MGLKKDYYGTKLVLVLEHGDFVKFVAVPGAEIFLFVCRNNGKLVVQCETGNEIEEISGPGMKEKISDMEIPLPNVNSSVFIEKIYWKEVSEEGKFYLLPVLVPASLGMTCVWLSVEDDRWVIEGGSSIIDSFVGPGLMNKIKEQREEAQV